MRELLAQPSLRESCLREPNPCSARVSIGTLVIRELSNDNPCLRKSSCRTNPSGEFGLQTNPSEPSLCDTFDFVQKPFFGRVPFFGRIWTLSKSVLSTVWTSSPRFARIWTPSKSALRESSLREPNPWFPCCAILSTSYKSLSTGELLAQPSFSCKARVLYENQESCLREPRELSSRILVFLLTQELLSQPSLHESSLREPSLCESC